MKDNKGKNDNTLGKRIRMLRNACGLTQDELASDLFVSRTGISNYETNKRTPDVEMLKKLCERFNVSMNYLLGNTSLEDEKNALDKATTEIKLYLTKDGHLDLSGTPPIVKIFIVELYVFLMQRYGGKKYKAK